MTDTASHASLAGQSAVTRAIRGLAITALDQAAKFRSQEVEHAYPYSCVPKDSLESDIRRSDVIGRWKRPASSKWLWMPSATPPRSAHSHKLHAHNGVSGPGNRRSDDRSLPDPSWYRLRAQLSTKPFPSSPALTSGPSTSRCKESRQSQ